jgi:hypothetical protein
MHIKLRLFVIAFCSVSCLSITCSNLITQTDNEKCIWHENVVISNDAYSSSIRCLAENNQNDIYAAGASSNVNGKNDLFIIKMDQDGHQKWSKIFSGRGFGNIKDICISKTGGITATGESDSLSIYQINDHGDSIWYKSYCQGGGRAIITTTDGGYAAAGNSTADKGEPMCLLRVDSS